MKLHCFCRPSAGRAGCDNLGLGKCDWTCACKGLTRANGQYLGSFHGRRGVPDKCVKTFEARSWKSVARARVCVVGGKALTSTAATAHRVKLSSCLHGDSSQTLGQARARRVQQRQISPVILRVLIQVSRVHLSRNRVSRIAKTVSYRDWQSFPCHEDKKS
jgi:hypothetical protein